MSTQQTRTPISNGSYNQWSPSAGQNWQCVDDPVGAHNSDADYSSAMSSFHNQHYATAAFDLDASAINYVKSYFVLRRVGSAGPKIYPRLRVNGANYQGDLLGTLPETYTTQTMTYLTNPDTGLDWTEADVEGTGPAPLQQVGMRSGGVSWSAEERIRCTQCYLEVDYQAASDESAIAGLSRRVRWAIMTPRQ